MESKQIFESVLRDAIFVPLAGGTEARAESVQILEGTVFHVRLPPQAGYWTLKFDNGAIVSVWSGPNSDNSVWWIGESYSVVESGKVISARPVKDFVIGVPQMQIRKD